MKKITIVFIISAFLLPLFAINPDVFTTNQEISAYKHMYSEETEPVPPSDPTSVSFTVLDPETNSEIGQGANKPLTSVILSEANYAQNKTFSQAFSWRMTGNVFRETITVKYTFGPLCSETIPFSGNMICEDATKVIPYTVTLSSNGTTVEGINGVLGTTAITKNNYYGKGHYDVSSGRYDTYSFYLADNYSYVNNQVLITMASKTITYTCDLYTNSYVKKNNSNTNYKDYYDSCNLWTRSGYASITLGLNNDGYSWTETVNNNSVTHKLTKGSATYKANVVVTITVGN